MTKCPYVPPHPWNVDFPHLMLRAKAIKYKKGEVGSGEKLLASTDVHGQLAGIPIVAQTVNAANRTRAHAREGYAIVTAIPSCTLMFKPQERELLFAEDADVKLVSVFLLIACVRLR